MGQRLTIDRIGALSHNAGIITLAASRLTIGGQQYTTPSLTVAVGTPIANTLYMLYVVNPSGTPSLVQSINVNSVGPAGFASWKLVGAYYSSGIAVPAFGAFVNIEGVPESGVITYTPSSTWVTNTTPSGRWVRRGALIFLVAGVTLAGVPNNSGLTLGFPTNLTVKTADLASSGLSFNGRNSANGVRSVTGVPLQTLLDSSASTLIACYAASAGVQAQLTNVAPVAWNAPDAIEMSSTCSINGWSNTPLKDL